MSRKFWYKRALISLLISCLLIFAVQFIKYDSLGYACVQAVIWGPCTAMLYLLILWNKLRKNIACAAKHN